MSTPGCRDLCAARGEPLIGSAGSAALWVGMAWPKPLWHADKVALSPGLPAEIATLESDVQARGSKLALRLFQREVGPPRDRVELLLFERGREAVSLAEVPLARVAPIVRAFAAGDPIAADAAPMAPQLLVCTDGKHDACCARYGRILHQALARSARAAGAHVGVAETSHLGGHRFAACCLSLPEGHLYGRVEVDDAPRLVRAVSRGEILPDRLRGELGYSELRQVARAAARARGYTPTDDADEQIAGERATVRLCVRQDGRLSHLLVHCERATFRGANSCNPAGATEPNLRWVDTGVAPA